MKKKLPSINLFKEGGKSFVDRFLKWALNTGRLIIILTEIIALSAFLYRFSLDRQLIDLSDKIKQQEKIIELLHENEKQYRNLQERLTFITLLGNSSDKKVQTFKDILKRFPKDMLINSVSLHNKGISLNGSVSSIASLHSFIKQLKDFSLVKNTSIQRLDNKISNSTITFNLTIGFN